VRVSARVARTELGGSRRTLQAKGLLSSEASIHLDAVRAGSRASEHNAHFMSSYALYVTASDSRYSVSLFGRFLGGLERFGGPVEAAEPPRSAVLNRVRRRP